MADGNADLKNMLINLADAAGPFEPPPAEQIATARRPRAVAQPLLAALATAAVVLALAIGLSARRSHGSNTFTPPTVNTAPAGPVVDPTGYRWTDLPAAPIAPRSPAASVWTGTYFIVWGGQKYNPRHAYTDGAAYDPTDRTWRVLPPIPTSVQQATDVAAIDGQVYAWGSADYNESKISGGARFDPSTWTWHSLAAPPIGTYFWQTLVTVNGTAILLSSAVGKSGASRIRTDRFDPQTGEWTALPDYQSPGRHSYEFGAAVDAAGLVLAFVDWTNPVTTSDGYSVGNNDTGTDSLELDPSTGAWSSTRYKLAPATFSNSPVWLGSRVALFGVGWSCGLCSGPPSEGPGKGVVFDARSGARTDIAPSDLQRFGSYYWTGSVVLAVSDSDGQVGAWDPVMNRWSSLSSAKLADTGFEPVWTGQTVLEWGDSASPATAGAQFGPAAH